MAWSNASVTIFRIIKHIEHLTVFVSLFQICQDVKRKTSLKRISRTKAIIWEIRHIPPLTLHMKSTRDHWNFQPLYQPFSKKTFYFGKQVNLLSSLHCMVLIPPFWQVTDWIWEWEKKFRHQSFAFFDVRRPAEKTRHGKVPQGRSRVEARDIWSSARMLCFYSDEFLLRVHQSQFSNIVVNRARRNIG